MCHTILTPIFDMLNNAYSKYYAPLEHPTVDKVIGLYRGRVNFKQYTPKKQKHFPIKICKLCNIHMTWTCAQGRIGHIWLHTTATRVTVRNLTGKVELHEHQVGGTQLKCNWWTTEYSVSTHHPHIPDRFWNGFLEHTDHFLHLSVSLYIIIQSLCMTLNDTCRTDQPTGVWLFNILTYRIIHKILWYMYRGSQLPLNP